ncbi:MAG: hypothetical protein ACRDO9_03375, partial [Gaiellales bacterium]
AGSTAVAAHDIAQALDQHLGPAGRAGVEVGLPVGRPLAVGADEHLTALTDTTPPGARPAYRVDLAGSATVARHDGSLAQSAASAFA